MPLAGRTRWKGCGVTRKEQMRPCCRRLQRDLWRRYGECWGKHGSSLRDWRGKQTMTLPTFRCGRTRSLPGRRSAFRRLPGAAAPAQAAGTGEVVGGGVERLARKGYGSHKKVTGLNPPCFKRASSRLRGRRFKLSLTYAREGGELHFKAWGLSPMTLP